MRYFAENPELLDDPSSDPHEILREHFASMLAASIIEKARESAGSVYRTKRCHINHDD